MLALKPLDEQFGIEKLFVCTMQAVSGAGYPGVASLDILGNVVPFIKNEEEKLQEEVGKLLGALEGDHIHLLDAKLSAHCNRVAVDDGHTECVSIKLRRPATYEQMLAAWADFRPLEGIHEGQPLPSAPAQPVEYEDAIDRPQPRLDRMRGNGMTSTVGRLRPCSLFDWKFVAALAQHHPRRGRRGHSQRRGSRHAGQARLEEPGGVHESLRMSTARSQMVVMKFGGTSVEDAAAMKRTAAIVTAPARERPPARGRRLRHGQGHGPASCRRGRRR